MERLGSWILGIVLVAGAIGLFLWYRARGDTKGAKDARADIIEAWHEPKVRAAHAHADRMAAAFAADSNAVRDARAEVERVEGELAAKFKGAELSPSEIAARLSRLRV